MIPRIAIFAALWMTVACGSSAVEPTDVGPHTVKMYANYDAWVAKVSSAGNLVWATYLGGDDYDYGYALAEKSGDVFVLGKTGSETISGASPYTWQGGGWDGFVAKYKSTGALSFFTYFGGSSLDYAEDIALYRARFGAEMLLF